MRSSHLNNSTFVKAPIKVIPTQEFLRIMGTLQQADHYLLSLLQTFIQPVTLQAPLNFLQNKTREISFKKRSRYILTETQEREDAVTTLFENEVLKKAIKTKDENMVSVYEEIAVLKQQTAIDGNARENRAEKVKMKRGKSERIAAAVAVEKQAQARADAAKAEAAFRAVQAKAEQTKQKGEENNNNKKWK